MVLYRNIVLLLLSNLAVSAVAQLTFTAIPDQDEGTLQARANAVTNYLESYIQTTCGTEVFVTYNPVSNYQDAVSALLDKTADFVWYGGLTGVQAGLRSPPSTYLAQRIEDTQFTSVFIQGLSLQLTDIADVEGKTLAYGSEDSTSGHLMPAYYLGVSNITPASFIFTGSHDATADAVINEVTEVGALNSVVWANRVAANTTGGASVFHTTDEYVDYLWVAGSGIVDTWNSSTEGATSSAEGCADINSLLTQAFLAATSDEPLGEALLAAYSTGGYVAIAPGEYDAIEETGCALELIEEKYCSEPIPDNLGNISTSPPPSEEGSDAPADDSTETPTSGANAAISGVVVNFLRAILPSIILAALT